MAIAIALSQIVQQEVKAYAGEWTGMDGKPSRFYFLENPDDQVFCVVAPQTGWRKNPEVIVMARVVNGQVVIDIDKTDKPLREALQQAGVPDSQIVIPQQPT